MQLPIDPTDYYGPHRDHLQSYGGYAPNMPISSTTLSIGGGRRRQMETSTMKRDYTPHCLPSAEMTAGKNVFLGRSGFSSGKALHLPSTRDVMRAQRAQASEFYNSKSRLSPDTCGIPTAIRTEAGERFKMGPLSEQCGTANYNATHYWINSPGSRDSGFTSGYSSINPVFWRQHEPLMDQLGRNPPEIRSNAASVSQTDYRPHAFTTYESAPIQGILQTRLTKGTGFTTSKELHPCFLPEPCVYGHHTTSYLGDPSRYNTSYNTDFRARPMITDTSGCQIVGKGPALKNTVGESPDFSLGCGAPRSFISETRESYLNHWPLEGQRNFGLSFPISKVSSSGFVHSIKKHGVREKPCEGGIYDSFDNSPQRYNPWPKFYLGHRTMVDKGYRPNPLTSGITDYAITTSLPTTGSNAEVFLY